MKNMHWFDYLNGCTTETLRKKDAWYETAYRKPIMCNLQSGQRVVAEKLL